MTRPFIKLFLCASLNWAGVAHGQSNIDPDHAFSWGENIGWLNWRCDPENGVIVGAEYLSGYIWAENVGWIDLGDGNGPYANNDDTDFGVNILPDGDLDGFAWGENIGWINFNTAGHAPNQARFDFAAGRFRGYAWGENIGWINLDDAVRFVGVIPPPLPVPGDFDGDGFVDLVDYAAFVLRMNGPFADPTLAGWHLFDLDPDYDVDLRDFAGFQRAFMPIP